MTDPTDAHVDFIHVLALGIDPAWRSRSDDERSHDLGDLSAAITDRAAAVRTLSYTSVGLTAGVDLLLWRSGPDIETLERAAAAVLGSAIGPWLRVGHAFLGRTAPSQYTSARRATESGLTEDGEGRYLVVYPFTKDTDWYLRSREWRQGVMNEHIRVGREYPMVRQALTYSFGIDDQDFIVAYETDDLVAFGDLVRDLRATESRRSTVRDTPILVGVRRAPAELPALLGPSA